jgi:hypothetical protein
MQTVRDEAGRRYLLLEQSGETSSVLDPVEGETREVKTAALDRVDEPPLETAALGVDDALRRVLTAVHDERALGLLLEIDRRGPVSVRTLLAESGLCESDLHGLLTEFRAAGMVAETDLAGGRAYDTTEACASGLEALRE